MSELHRFIILVDPYFSIILYTRFEGKRFSQCVTELEFNSLYAWSSLLIIIIIIIFIHSIKDKNHHHNHHHRHHQLYKLQRRCVRMSPRACCRGRSSSRRDHPLSAWLLHWCKRCHSQPATGCSELVAWSQIQFHSQ